MTGMMKSLWNYLKLSHPVPIGPVSLVLRLARRRRVSNNLVRGWRTPNGPPPQAARATLDGPQPGAPASSAVSPSPGSELAAVETALIVGVGPGLGHALARAFAAAGMRVALASRDAERLDPLVQEIALTARQAVQAYGCDATDAASVHALVERVTRDMGTPDLVVYAVQAFVPGRAVEVEVTAFEECWRQNCLGGFIVAREAARAMLPRHRGSIILVGSTSGRLGRADHLNLAVGKFGLRATAQVMAQELWPEGIHVLHCVIDADIRERSGPGAGERQALPEDIAAVLLGTHQQPRSCWTSELDLRPFNQRFWVHC